MTRHDHVTYPPLNTLKPIADDVWIVDGPAIEFGMPWPKMRFPTRMTLLRTGGDDLLVHSPTPLTRDLMRQVETIGTPRWIIGPNRIHYWWIPEWREVFPEAQVYLAPRIHEQADGRIDFRTLTLDRASGYPWDKDITTLPVTGRFMTEVEFFHRPSRTLVLTDFIENFEPHKLDLLARWITRFAGSRHPDGQMPRDMRMTFRGPQRSELKEAVERMIAWNPERVILAHGLWYERDGAAELRRAFRWLLD